MWAGLHRLQIYTSLVVKDSLVELRLATADSNSQPAATVFPITDRERGNYRDQYTMVRDSQLHVFINLNIWSHV